MVEELDPFLEEHIRLLGVKVDGGKDLLPLCGEFNPGLVARSSAEAGVPGVDAEPAARAARAGGRRPARPPADALPGLLAPRRLRRAQASCACSSAATSAATPSGALPPFEAMHCSICMGASISMAHGMAKVHGRRPADHEEPPGGHHRRQHLLPLRHHLAHGRRLQQGQRAHHHPRQPHHGHDRRPGEPGHRQDPAAASRRPTVDIPALVPRPGHQARPRDRPVRPRADVEAVLKEEMAAEEPSVVIAKSPCVLQYKIKRRRLPGGRRALHRLQASACGRGAWLSTCTRTRTASRKVEIDPVPCNGCGVCAQLCKFDAIKAPRSADGRRRRRLMTAAPDHQHAPLRRRRPGRGAGQLRAQPRAPWPRATTSSRAKSTA